MAVLHSRLGALLSWPLNRSRLPSSLGKFPSDSRLNYVVSPSWVQGFNILRPHQSRLRVCIITFLICLVCLWNWYTNLSPVEPYPRGSPVFINATGHLPHIPPYIWQLYLEFSSEKMEPYTGNIFSWVSNSPSYNYAILDSTGANTIMSRLMKDPKYIRLVNVYYAMGGSRRVMAGDFLRYLLLALEGGVYSDMDTTLRRPIKDWVPEEYKQQTKLIIGIEYDDEPDKGVWMIESRMQFCQWTLAAAPDHPLLWSMIDRIADSMEKLAHNKDRPIAGLEFTDRDVLNLTGPKGWTELVFQYLSRTMGEPIDYRNLTGIGEPKLMADVLVLPINAFGTGQGHSGSVESGSDDALVVHHFGGSWRFEHWTPS